MSEEQKPKRTRNPVSSDVKQELTDWFEKHREDIRYAKKAISLELKQHSRTRAVIL